MSHAKGAYLGGICSLETLRQRCYIGPKWGRKEPCWHLRTARGKPMPKGDRHAIWVTGQGSVSAVKAAIEFGGRVVPKGHYGYRKCLSYDCVNPQHLGTRTLAKHAVKAFALRNYDDMVAANRAAGMKRSKLDDEARKRIAFSGERLIDLAALYGVCVSWAGSIRKRERAKAKALFADAMNDVMGLAAA